MRDLIEIGIDDEGDQTKLLCEIERLRKHHQLEQWLQSIGLSQYCDVFVENGFGECVDALSEVTDEMLEERMGIVVMAHRLAILKAIKTSCFAV